MIVGVLLAAGAGTRFGGRKLLYPLSNGTSLGITALRNLKSSVSKVVVVVRPGEEELRQLIAREEVAVVECAEAAGGMGHSLAAGVAAEPSADGWVIALGDMPRLRPDTIRAVVRALEGGAEIVVPVFGGQRGHPVGFGRSFRCELLGLSGDAGARTVLTKHASAVRLLEVDDAGVVQDIDTLADAARLADA